QRSADLTLTPRPRGLIQRLGIADVLDGLAELAANVPGFTLLTLIIGRNPINMRVVERSAVNVLRAFIGLIPGGEILFQVLERYPFTNAPVPRTAMTVVRAFAEFIPGGTEKVNQLAESGALERAYAWFTQETQSRNLTWGRVTGTFAEAWAALRLEDVLHPI